MTWLESWEGSYCGEWFGAQEPEPQGSMRATLRGSSSVLAKLTAPEDVIYSGVWSPPPNNKRPPKKVTVEIYANLSGKSSLTATATASADIATKIAGQSNVSANLTGVFNFREHRRIKDEEAVAAWLMAA